MSAVASLIFKRRKFGRIGTLPRVGHGTKLSNQRTKASIREVNNRPMVILAEFLCRETSRRKIMTGLDLMAE